MPRIYLDNAATSFPKPESVYAAVERYMREVGAPAGRGGYAEALEADRIVQRARLAIARLFHVHDPSRFVFTFNGTDSLNLALYAVLKPGDHVVTSSLEHNSVVRPLAHLRERLPIDITELAVGTSGVIDPDDVARAIGPRTRLVAITHASNVTGALQPVEEVARLARSRGVLTLIDGAQTAGHVPLDLSRSEIDLFAASGHKGLLGPLGTGFLYIRKDLEQHLSPWRCGGTGTHSENPHQPLSLPDRFEAGNLNLPGLAGLAAAAEFLNTRSVAVIAEHLEALTHQLLTGLETLPGLRTHAPQRGKLHTSVISLSVDNWDPRELATVLDQSFGIQARAGLHCAPGAHRPLGTLDQGGTLRLSPGPFSTAEEIATTLNAFEQLTATG